ncbi:hypothetical protein GCM10009759_40870 [Kitasatospora saccharophila]|uniref:Uncharacterized protein n=1 Tax=Kitasatospora saccharophila TaxID=407973 RepID=A0ABN2X750_9ACTN
MSAQASRFPDLAASISAGVTAGLPDGVTSMPKPPESAGKGKARHTMTRSDPVQAVHGKAT